MYDCEIEITQYRNQAAVIDQNGKALLDIISFVSSKEGCEELLALLERLATRRRRFSAIPKAKP